MLRRSRQARLDKQKPDYVLLDDEASMTDFWSRSAKSHDIELMAFASETEFLEKCESIPRSTPIMIDQRLGGDWGHLVARRLVGKKFSELYIVTADPEGVPSGLNYIKEVRSKSPPWLDEEMDCDSGDNEAISI